MKPGWKTTEFWLTVLTIIVGLVSQLRPDLVSETSLITTVLAQLGYTGSRAVVKRPAPSTGDTAQGPPPGPASPAVTVNDPSQWFTRPAPTPGPPPRR